MFLHFLVDVNEDLIIIDLTFGAKFLGLHIQVLHEGLDLADVHTIEFVGVLEIGQTRSEEDQIADQVLADLDIIVVTGVGETFEDIETVINYIRNKVVDTAAVLTSNRADKTGPVCILLDYLASYTDLLTGL